MATRSIHTVLHGHAELISPWFSNSWRLIQDDRELVRLQRFGRLHLTTATLPDGERWLMEPHGRGVVRALDEEGNEFARVTRRSWFGRRWDVTGVGFAYELLSDPRPRHWHIAVGGAPVAELCGSLVSYNRVSIDCTLSVPLVAVLLAWHVIARPWEAAAAPKGLVPTTRPAPRMATRPSPATMEEPT